MANNNVLLCGAAQGIGKICANKFLEAGWNAIVLDIRSPEDRRMTYYACDLSDYEASAACIDQILEQYQRIDAVINCVRYRNQGSPGKDPFQRWKKALEVDLDTYFNTSSLVCQAMKEIGSGCSIVNISSVLSELVTLEQSVSYHTAKAAINQYTRYLAVEYGPYDIRANTISPGLISNHHAEKSSDDPEASAYAKRANYIPLRRTGSPQDVAELVYFLASTASSFITGQNIVIDGGLSLCEQLGLIAEKEVNTLHEVCHH